MLNLTQQYFPLSFSRLSRNLSLSFFWATAQYGLCSNSLFHRKCSVFYVSRFNDVFPFNYLIYLNELLKPEPADGISAFLLPFSVFYDLLDLVDFSKAELVQKYSLAF